MSGKAYTMKEMKTIVDYLVEHKAYGTIKGRKMWIDFSNSPITSRSWQSLKETFLKRILPDIHNPYYKLTRDQVQSFRQGIDIQERERNKLEMQIISDDSGSNAETPNGNEQPSTSKNNGDEQTAGEGIASKINSRNRSSVDTVILETCYETAEDVLRDLESPSSTKSQDDPIKSQSKSLRDLITYSEPLTPMLQEVLHDFATSDDSDSGDPKMQIVENVSESEQGNKSPRKLPDPVNENVKKNEDQGDKNDSNESDHFIEPKVKSLRLRKRQGVYEPVGEQKSLENVIAAADKPNNSDDNKTNSNENIVEDFSEPSVIIISGSSEKTVDKPSKTNAQSTQNCSSSTTDTVLPNNQEALDAKNVTDSKNENNDFNQTNANVNTVTIKSTVSHEKHTSQITNLEDKTNQQHIPISDRVVMHEKTHSTNNSDVDANASEAVVDQVKETISTGEHTRKSSEIDTQDILPPNKTAKELNTSTQTFQKNPCLQSVSLFAEQFNLTNYLDSESSNHECEPSPSSTKQSPDKPLDVIEKPRNGDANDVVVLKSHSESESDTNKGKPKKHSKQGVSKSKRDKVLANVFGFSSGAVTSKRKKLSSYRKNSASNNYHGHNSSTDSSEWTSESDSDYVSPPPRGHRNRRTRKYLKPKSARIHSLEDDGGLFVMYGKKIYPLVKDGGSIRNYLVYSPDSDPDNEENFWKQKYVEQRQRVVELKKFIKQSKKDTERDPSPLLPTRASGTLTVSQERCTKSKTISISDSDKDPAPKEEIQHKEPVVETKNKTLKITFAKNNQEVHLEGHWSQLHPVLADVVEIFHKDTNTSEPSTEKSEPSTEKSEPSTKKSELSLPKAIRAKSPVVLAPIDEEAHKNVDKLETEIFKEIEERAKEEQTETKDPIENNVTKRKRPNRLSSTSTEVSSTRNPSPESTRSSKRAKTTKKPGEVNNVNEEKDLKVEEEENKSKESPNKVEQKATDTPSKARVITKRTRTPKKEHKETVKVVVSNESKPKTRRYNLAVAEEANQSIYDDEADVRYMFPPTRKSAKKSTTSVGKANEPTKPYSINIRSIFSPPDTCLHSESTQGYQDSDVSPPKIMYRKKRRLSVSTVQCKNKNKHNRMKRSLPIITNEHSSDSNNSYHIILKPTSDCSLKSEDYRSESYQMLMGNKRKNILKPLEKIEEDSHPSNNNFEIRNLDIPTNSEMLKSQISLNITNDLSPKSSNTNGDGANSSNISLPLSPELSMVENLSVSKELINRISNHPTLNELHLNDMTKNTARKYLISRVDVTMPLMQQECGVYRSFDRNIRSAGTDNETKNPVVSESVLNKINTVNIKECPSLSESLDTRLKNLLLESAKKITKSDESNEDIPTNKEEAVKKTRSKRCSTPRKKKDTLVTKTAKARKIDPVIEEECMEFCSYGGRKSCPPSIHIINDEYDINEILNAITAKNAPKDKSKVKRKKDIIKVKITRPSKDKKTKSIKHESSLNKAKSINRASIPINSEINSNESGISSQDFSDGIDLIHNHSETCLQANECIGDSVEFLEMTAKSIISVNSNSSVSCDCKERQQFVFQDCTDISLFCNNAQDGSTPCKINQVVPVEATGDTVYHSPSDMSLTSLITEDLSDEIRSSQSTKWYLLSEDETNTNAGPQNQHGFGANLKQLFPLACAVPDLSTITEMSKENDDSRKPTLEASSCDNNTMNDIDSQSAFDMNL